MSHATHEENEEPRLTPKQEELIIALLSSPTLTLAAQQVHVPLRTAQRWQKLPHFQASYRAAQQEKFTESLSLLQTGVSTAIKTLYTSMTSDTTPPAVQVRAAQIWLEQAIRMHTIDDLMQRVVELENIIQDRNG
jgi:hypothetical protein